MPKWNRVEGNSTKERGANSWLVWMCVLTIAIVLLLIGILVAASIMASLVQRRSCDAFRYEVPFVCGINPGSLVRVATGTYATSVHIHNPQSKTVDFWKRLSISFPPPEQAPGIVSIKIDDFLNSLETLMVDCQEIFTDDNFNVTDGPPYMMGMLLVHSEESLTIWAEQTVSDASFVQSPIPFDNVIPRNVTTMAVYKAEERCVIDDHFFDSFYK